jgi:hypothetical protein
MDADSRREVLEVRMPRNFWMIVSNVENYRITHNLGFTVQGLKAQHRRKMQRIESGDRVLFYVSGARHFAATATATSSFFEDESAVWQNEGCAGWPYRIEIKPEVVLDDAQCIDANILAPRLDYIKRWPPENWYMAFQGNLHLLPKTDFLLIEEEMRKLKFGRDYDRGRAIQPHLAPRKKKRKRAHGPSAAPSAPGPRVA